MQDASDTRNAASRPSGLRKRLVGATAWSLGGQVAGQVLRFGSNLVLTRLLVPEAFGLILVAISLVVTLQLLTDTGVSQAVIRHQGTLDRSFLGTAWCLNIIKGAVLAVAVLAAAGLSTHLQAAFPSLAASAYGSSQFPQVLAALSLWPFITGLQSMRSAIASRNLDLKGLVTIDLVSQLVGSALTIALALYSPSVWAMVWSLLCTALITTVLTHTILPGERDAFCWSSTAARQLLGFGRWIWFSSSLGVVGSQLDRLLLGAIAPVPWLGLYSIAVALIGTVESVFSRTVAAIALPVLSRLVGQDASQAIQTFRRYALAVDVLGAFSIGLFWMSGAAIVAVLYPTSYGGAGPILSVLAFTLVLVRAPLSTQLYLAMNRPYLQTVIAASKLVLASTMITAGYLIGGIDGALWGLVGHAVALYAITVVIDHVLGARWRLANLLPLVGFACGALFGALVNRAIEAWRSLA